MLRFCFILFMTVSPMFSLGAQAGELKEFPGSDRIYARERIQLYLNEGTGFTGDNDYLDGIEVEGLAAIDLALDEVLRHTSGQPLGEGLKARLRHLVLMASRWSRGHVLSEDPGLALSLQEKSSRLLELYHHPSGMQKSLVNLFDLLKLWDVNDFWFFRRMARNQEALIKNYFRFRVLIARLPPAEREDFAQALSLSRPYDLIQLGLIYKTGLINIRQLTKYFQLASERFAAVHNYNFESSLASSKIREMENEILVEILTQLLLDFHAGQPMVVEAFQKAESSVSKSVPSTTKTLRLKFFELARKKSFHWGDRQSWYEAPAEEPAIPEEPELYTKEGNVLTVQFGLPKKCEDEL